MYAFAVLIGHSVLCSSPSKPGSVTPSDKSSASVGKLIPEELEGAKICRTLLPLDCIALLRSNQHVQCAIRYKLLGAVLCLGSFPE